MKIPTYKYKNREEKKMVYKLLYALGFNNNNHPNLDDVFKNIDQGGDNMISINPYINISHIYSKQIFGSDDILSANKQEYPTIGEFIQAVIQETNEFHAKVKLNRDYTADVTKESIQVGCQDFTHEAIKTLYEKSVEAQKSEYHNGNTKYMKTPTYQFKDEKE